MPPMTKRVKPSNNAPKALNGALSTMSWNVSLASLPNSTTAALRSPNALPRFIMPSCKSSIAISASSKPDTKPSPNASLACSTAALSLAILPAKVSVALPAAPSNLSCRSLMTSSNLRPFSSVVV